MLPPRVFLGPGGVVELHLCLGLARLPLGPPLCLFHPPLHPLCRVCGPKFLLGDNFFLVARTTLWHRLHVSVCDEKAGLRSSVGYPPFGGDDAQ